MKCACNYVGLMSSVHKRVYTVCPQAGYKLSSQYSVFSNFYWFIFFFLTQPYHRQIIWPLLFPSVLKWVSFWKWWIWCFLWIIAVINLFCETKSYACSLRYFNKQTRAEGESPRPCWEYEKNLQALPNAWNMQSVVFYFCQAPAFIGQFAVVKGVEVSADFQSSA